MVVTIVMIDDAYTLVNELGSRKCAIFSWFIYLERVVFVFQLSSPEGFQSFEVGVCFRVPGNGPVSPMRLWSTG